MPSASGDVSERLFALGLEAGERLISTFEESSLLHSAALYRGVMLCFFAKAFKSFQAIHTLWKGGFAEDAFTVSRSLFELMLQATWIYKSPVPRADRFIEHERVASYIYYERLKRTGRDPGLLTSLERRAEQLAQLKNDFDKFKSHFATKKGNRFHEHWWKGSIPELAEQLGPDYQMLYERLYRHMSGYVHSDAHSFVDYFVEDARGLLVSCRPSQPKGTSEMIPILSAGWMIDITYMTNSALDTKLDEFLTNLRKVCTGWFRERLAEAVMTVGSWNQEGVIFGTAMVVTETDYYPGSLTTQSWPLPGAVVCALGRGWPMQTWSAPGPGSWPGRGISLWRSPTVA